MKDVVSCESCNKQITYMDNELKGYAEYCWIICPHCGKHNQIIGN